MELDPITFIPHGGTSYTNGKIFNNQIDGFADLLRSGLAETLGLGLTEEQLADNELMREKAKRIIDIIANMKQLYGQSV